MPRTILLADDSITIQKIVNLTFSGEGIDVVTVGNGDAALKKIFEVHPDVVLADIFMPGKNGYEVCEYIKNEPRLRSTPVILLVGAFEPFDTNEASRVRADGHLTKPFEIKVLISAVNSLISAGEEKEEKREIQAAVSDNEMPATQSVPFSSPEMPQAFRPEPAGESEAEGAASPSFEQPVPSIPLGVRPDEEEFPERSNPGSLAERFVISSDRPDPDHREIVPTAPVFIEESDPLGLLAGELSHPGTADASDLSFDTKSLVVDIWEPRSSAVKVAGERASETVLAPPKAKPVDPAVEVSSQQIEELETFREQLTEPAEVANAVSDPLPQIEAERPAIKNEPEPIVLAPSGKAMSVIDSEELIERIANRVVERLSREVIEKIAWEVVPDLAELMIKEQVETHLKALRQP
jgi:CheY-like chemotaxis protein